MGSEMQLRMNLFLFLNIVIEIDFMKLYDYFNRICELSTYNSFYSFL